jgi:hypothetical protein
MNASVPRNVYDAYKLQAIIRPDVRETPGQNYSEVFLLMAVPCLYPKLIHFICRWKWGNSNCYHNTISCSLDIVIKVTLLLNWRQVLNQMANWLFKPFGCKYGNNIPFGNKRISS